MRPVVVRSVRSQRHVPFPSAFDASLPPTRLPAAPFAARSSNVTADARRTISRAAVRPAYAAPDGTGRNGPSVILVSRKLQTPYAALHVRNQSIWSYLSGIVGGSTAEAAPTSPDPTETKRQGPPSRKQKRHPKTSSSPAATAHHSGTLRPRRKNRRSTRSAAKSGNSSSSSNTTTATAANGKKANASPSSHQRRRRGSFSTRKPSSRSDISVSNNPEIEAIARRLLDDKKTPVGSFRLSNWQEAERALRFMVEKESNTTPAFDLIDRLVEERDAPDHISLDVMYNTMQTWLLQLREYKKHQSSQARTGTDRKSADSSSKGGSSDKDKNNGNKPSNDASVLSTGSVWRKLKYYQSRGIDIDERICHRVIEGTSFYRSLKAVEYGPLLAEDILTYMLQHSRANPILRPSAVTFSLVMKSWLRSDAGTVERVMALFNQLQALHASGWGEDFLPDATVYRTAMNVFKDQGDTAAMEKLLEDMYAMYIRMGRPPQLEPQTVHFSIALHAWSESKDPQSTERATVLLERMIDLQQSGELPSLSVRAIDFNAVMLTYSKTRSKRDTQICLALFNKMKQFGENNPAVMPTGATYAILISMLAEHDPMQSAKLFREWHSTEKLSIEVRPHRRLFTHIIRGLCKSDEPGSVEEAIKLVTAVLFGELKMWPVSAGNIAMISRAMSKKGTAEAIEKMEELMRKIATSDDKKVRALYATKSMSLIITIWAKLGELERAVNVLDELLEHHGDSIDLSDRKYLGKHTFIALIEAWSKSDDTAAAENIGKLLLKMRQLDIPPNPRSFRYAAHCGVAPWQYEDAVALLDEVYYAGKLHESEAVYQELRKSLSGGGQQEQNT